MNPLGNGGVRKSEESVTLKHVATNTSKHKVIV